MATSSSECESSCIEETFPAWGAGGGGIERLSEQQRGAVALRPLAVDICAPLEQRPRHLVVAIFGTPT